MSKILKNIHHVSQVVKDIKKAYDFYEGLGFEIAIGFETPQPDKEQKVMVGAIKLHDFLLELLEPASDDSPIVNFKKKGGGLHHICYEVENLEEAMKEIKEGSSARQITPITTSVWEKRPVVFFINKDNIVFELICK